MLLLRSEHKGRDLRNARALHRVLDRTCVLADELVLFEVVAFLANGLAHQNIHMTPLKRTSLIIVASKEFAFRVHVIPDQAARVGLKP